MCTLLEDLVEECKHRMRIQDRIILILSLLLLLFMTLSAYLGYNLYTNNDPNQDTEDVNEITMLNVSEEFEENNLKPIKRRKIVRFKV
ncbi:MAG: hypothetical protein MJ244_04375 [Clostridia bacterium]|nr:hypothetical protein [Clostridia bacterium]